jgi:hypothetical protein
VRRSVVLVALAAILFTCLALPGNGFAGPLQPNATFTGGVAFSADAVRGDIAVDHCPAPQAAHCLQVDTTATNILPSPNSQDVTVKAAYLYNVTFAGPLSPPIGTTLATLNGSPVTLSLLQGTDPTPIVLQTYRADVTSIVAPLVNGAPKLTQFSFSVASINPGSNGLALVVVFSSPGLDPSQSVAILDGGQAGPTLQTTAFGLANPLDKNIPNFNAVLSLGIQFSDQDVVGHACGQNPSFAQFSTVDVNGARLSSCAGNADKGGLMNGALITVGGVGDSTANPSDPFCQAGNPNCSTSDDELYGIAGFLKQGDKQVRIATANPSNDDSIFLAILQLNAAINQVCTVGVNCPPPCTGADCPTPPPGVPGPATLILLGAGLLALIAGSRLFRRR